MICYRLDSQLLKFAKEARAIYTRYADDITFSSFQPPTRLFSGAPPLPGRFTIENLDPAFLDLVSSNGFTVNPDKLHYADRHARKIVTGIKINEILNVDRHYIRDLRAALHSIELHGLKAASSKFRSHYGGQGGLGEHLAGKISWLRFIKGANDPIVRNLTHRFNLSFPDGQLRVEPTLFERRERSVWVIEHDGNCGTQGTCFFLKDVGLVTAAHCVEDVDDAEIYHFSKPANRFPVEVIRRDSNRDLALLRVSMPETEYFDLEYSKQPLTVGMTVTALGYPDHGPGDALSVRPGTISSLPVKSLVRKIEVTQRIDQGISGGPLVDDDGKVVGINHKGGPEMVQQLAIDFFELKSWLNL